MKSTNRLPPHAPPLVLVVDDSQADRDLHSILLRARGAEVVTAADGWEALVCARTLLPDLVVTDLRMPRMDGWELVDRLRADEATAAIPVILVTGDAAWITPTRVRDAGLASLMAKPIDLADFERTTAAALERPSLAPLPRS